MKGFKFLCHEEPRCKKMRAPDLVFIHAPAKARTLDCIIEVVEIENGLKDAIRNRKRGLEPAQEVS